jgi:predicted transcriptional regulator
MDTRSAIQEYLREHPGASTQMVARRASIDPSTADYHLRKLRKEGAVSTETVGRERTWYLTSAGLCPVLRAVLPAFRRADVARVAQALSDYPATTTRLARDSAVPIGQVRWASDVLLEAGIAEKTQMGRICLVPGGATCVERAKQGTPCALWGSCAPSRRRRL